MDGAFLVDKPQGLSSHDVVAKFRRAYKGVRFGHAGTLDPDASGVLLILAGRATRLQDVFLGSDKEYEGEIKLGVSSTTDDLTGEVLVKDEQLQFWNKFDEQSLVKAIVKEFSGQQQQLPPQVSAVHVDGKRSYKLARSGIEVEHKPRTVSIEFKRLEVVARDCLAYQVACSKGTYVRSLARDIGVFLGSHAATKSIRRIGSGHFSITTCASLDKSLEGEGNFLQLPQLLVGLPKIDVDEEQRALLESGRQDLLNDCGLPVDERFGAVYAESGDLVALLRNTEDRGWRLGYVLRR